MSKDKPVVKKKFALDIFSILGKLNKGDLTVWDSLSEEERKGFSPLIISRWMSGTNDPLQIILLNEFVNKQIFKLDKDHPELMCKLIACCGTGSKRVVWIGESKKKKSSSMALDVVKEYYDYTTHEALSELPLLSNDDIIELAEELGYQVDEIKKLKKELV
jgi:hypothetical protein